MFRRTTVRPTCEMLEDRLALAGNVAASAGEVLELRGDDTANQVRITQDASDSILIEGLNGTTINGQSSVRFDGSDLEKVDIKLFGGSDSLTVHNLRSSVDQNIEMDRGNDTVVLNGVIAGANLSVKTDDGFDRVFATGVRTGGDFFLETGQGRSLVAISGTEVGKTLTVIGGDSIDEVRIAGTTTQEDLNVEVKKGDDFVDLVNVTSHKNITVNTDVGNDFVAVTNVVAANDAVFLGEDGFDTFVNDGVEAGEKLEIKGFELVV